MCGQLLSALLIDWRGLFGTEKLTIHGGRIGGCILTLIGSVMVFAADDGGSDTSVQGKSLLMMIVSVSCALINGLFLPTQAAVNNMLKREKQLSTPETVGVSFLVAAISLTIIAALTFISFPAAFDTTEGDNWWMWFGGIVGVVYVKAGTQFSPIIGYSSFFIAIIAGQLTLSLLSDVFGLLGPVVPSATTALSLSGVACAACGALIVSVYKAKETSNRLNEPTAAAIMTMGEVNDGAKMTILQDSFGGIQQEYFDSVEMSGAVFNPLAYHDPITGLDVLEHHTDDHMEEYHVSNDAALQCQDYSKLRTSITSIDIPVDAACFQPSASDRVSICSYIDEDIELGRVRNVSNISATSEDGLLLVVGGEDIGIATSIVVGAGNGLSVY